MMESSSANIAEHIRAGAEQIVRETSGGIEVSSALTKFLSQFIVWPYSIGSVLIRELEATGDAAFATAIYTGSSVQQSASLARIDAVHVACIFYTAVSLSIEELKTGYRRIGAVKRVQRPHRADLDYPLNDVPLGVIFCIDSESSLEHVAEMMMEINKSVVPSEWPDMVVVLRKGTVNYAFQLEGDRIRGDFLLPASAAKPDVPMYAHVFARGLGTDSLNRFCSFLFMHLQVFSPGIKLPDKEAAQGISTTGMTLGAYLFNLSGQLVPVPDEMRTDKGAGLGNLPFRIESHSGQLLSHVQFIPWQEGGVIRVIGKIPLVGVLIYLGEVAKKAKVIPQESGEVSSVLPISRQDFLSALRKLQSQSNMVVKPEQPEWIVSKMSDEGSSSPFMARLFMGVLLLRDQVFDRHDRGPFDKAYESAISALSDARMTATEISQMLKEHGSKVASGEAARVSGRTIHVDGIDRELRKHVNDFLTSSARTLKQGMQSVAKSLGLDIGFFFRDYEAYEKGLAKLSAGQPEFADYLQEARSWAEKLITLRNKVEHEGWVLPRVGYREHGGKIEMLEPEVEGEPVCGFVERVLDRLCCFVEEVTVYGLQRQMESVLSITEIPLRERDPAAPVRFRPALAFGGAPLWKLMYHTTPFVEV